MFDGASRPLRHRALGEEALYRLVDGAASQLVELEVVRAPGLGAGARVRVTRGAASAMQGWEREAGSRPRIRKGGRRGPLVVLGCATAGALHALRAAVATARRSGLTARP